MIADARERWLPIGLAGLLGVATLGEGGASAGALLVVHAWVVALVLAVLLVRNDARRAVARGPIGAFTVFLVLVAGEAVVAPYAYAAVLVLLEIATFVAVALLAARCGPALLRPAGVALVAGAGLQGIVSIWQRVVEGTPRPAGTFLNSNHLGAWLVLALLAGFLPAPNGGRTGRFLRWGAVGPASVALLLSGSRGALLALVAGAAFWIAVSWRGIPPVRRRIVLAGAAVLVALASAGVVLRFRSPDPFPYQRFGIFRAALDTAVAEPWTGTGPGQFDVAAANRNFPVETGPLRYERFFTTTHSDVLRAPAEFGWPASCALLVAVLLSAREIRRRFREGSAGPPWIGATAALFALAVQGAVENLSERPAIYLAAAALLGALLSRPDHEPRTGLSARGAASWVLVSVFLVADVGPYLAWREIGRLPRGRLDPEQARALDRALARNPLHPDLWVRRAEHVERGDGELTLAGYLAAREAAEHAVRLQPADSRYRLAAARIESRACLGLFRDEASRLRAHRRYDEAIARARTDPFLVLEKGWFLLSATDREGAREAAESAIAIEPEAVPARLLLAAVRLDEGGPDARAEASAWLSEAERIAERWSDHPKETAYARDLLEVDELRAGWIRERLGDSGSADLSRPGYRSAVAAR